MTKILLVIIFLYAAILPGVLSYRITYEWGYHTAELNDIFNAPDWYGSCPLLHDDWIRECDGRIHPQYTLFGKLWQ